MYWAYTIQLSRQTRCTTTLQCNNCTNSAIAITDSSTYCPLAAEVTRPVLPPLGETGEADKDVEEEGGEVVTAATVALDSDDDEDVEG